VPGNNPSSAGYVGSRLVAINRAPARINRLARLSFSSESRPCWQPPIEHAHQPKRNLIGQCLFERSSEDGRASRRYRVSGTACRLTNQNICWRYGYSMRLSLSHIPEMYEFNYYRQDDRWSSHAEAKVVQTHRLAPGGCVRHSIMRCVSSSSEVITNQRSFPCFIGAANESLLFPLPIR
jgi:hypothetical protein